MNKLLATVAITAALTGTAMAGTRAAPSETMAQCISRAQGKEGNLTRAEARAYCTPDIRKLYGCIEAYMDTHAGSDRPTAYNKCGGPQQ